MWQPKQVWAEHIWLQVLVPQDQFGCSLLHPQIWSCTVARVRLNGLENRDHYWARELFLVVPKVRTRVVFGCDLLRHNELETKITLITSLVPRPRPAFRRFQYGKAGEGLE